MPVKREASRPSDWDEMLDSLECRSYDSLSALEAALDEHLAALETSVHFSGANALQVLEAENWLRFEGESVRLWLPSDQARVRVTPGPPARPGPLAES